MHNVFCCDCATCLLRWAARFLSFAGEAARWRVRWPPQTLLPRRFVSTFLQDPRWPRAPSFGWRLDSMVALSQQRIEFSHRRLEFTIRPRLQRLGFRGGGSFSPTNKLDAGGAFG